MAIKKKNMTLKRVENALWRTVIDAAESMLSYAKDHKTSGKHLARYRGALEALEEIEHIISLEEMYGDE